MKKVLLTIIVILVFGAYVLYQKMGQQNGSSQITAVSRTSSPTNTPSNNQSTPTTQPSTTSAYKDGTYTGIVADALYGKVQVQAVIQGGKITDVKYLQYPNDRGHTIEVSNMSLPVLKSETIQSQNANVDTVSGATQTSEAFIQSLQSALTQAKS